MDNMDSGEFIENGAPWVYRGEGNSSLVLASPSSHTVLRLRKVRTTASKDGPTALADRKSSLQGIVSYVDHVIRPMLPWTAWIPRMRVLRDFPTEGPHGLLQLVDSSRSDRDVARLLDTHALHQEAILMRDLCFLPGSEEREETPLTFSVELKPKEGVLPAGDGVHPARQKMSKYQMKQNMKVKNGSIQQANEYDPLDLFSGDAVRMKKSLLTLVQNPQNNFRVFINGTVQFDSQSPGMDNLVRVASKFLPPNNRNAGESLLDLVLGALQRSWCVVPDANRTDLNGLHKFSLLGGLLTAQRSCVVDIEPLHPQYLHVSRLFRERPGLREALGVDGPDFQLSPFWRGQDYDKFQLSPEEKVYLENCRSYLAAATVKDCSVFLTFQQTLPPATTLANPSANPSENSSANPSENPSANPSATSLANPSANPLANPSGKISADSSANPSGKTSADSSANPSANSSADLSANSSADLSAETVAVIELAPGVAFAFFASLVDLDPKPFERIEKHFVESQKLIELATKRA